MNELRVNRGFGLRVAAYLLLLLAWVPPGFYGVFFDHQFGDWTVFLGSHWFSEIADRQHLNYGCAPTELLRNAYGLAFWHALVVLGAGTIVAYFAAVDVGISRSLSVLGAAMMSGLGAVLVYFDAAFSLVPAPFICKAAPFPEPQFGLADQIVRHLCYEVGITSLLPVIVFGLGVWLCRRLGRFSKTRPATLTKTGL